MNLRRAVLASLAASLSAGALLLPAGALSQEPERGVGVAERARPAYDPVGLRAGSFIVYPAVTGSVAHEDNLFRQANNAQDDLIYTVQPEVIARSQWSRHALSAGATLLANAHDTNDSDDVIEYAVFAEGRVDVTRDTFIEGGVRWDVGHEGRGSPDLPGAAAEPAELRSLSAAVDLTHRFNRLSLRPGFSYTDTDYDDVGLVGGGTLNNDDRDREVMEVRLRAGYDVSPAVELFALGRYRDTTYDTFDDNLGGGGVARRDSESHDVLAGAAFDLGALARGEVAAGYTEQTYETPLIADFSGPIFEAGLEWFVTDLTTVSLRGSRSVQETTLDNAAGNLVTRVSAGVDHELLRNLLLGASGYWINNDYDGIAREDDEYGFTARATYLINRNLRAVLQYDYEARDSNVPGGDYDANILLLSLRAAL